MQLVWSAQFETGDNNIDSQHKHLFEIVNNLGAAVAQNNLEATVASTLASLKEYASKHFSTEEELMERSFYPHKNRHREEHNFFTAELAHLMRGGAENSSTLPNAVSSFVGDWLAKHILKEDLEFIRWCQQKL